ncbi:hypothetical protein JTE90_012272 [Oedothorax gibbosus]|uniref:Uncharacterized protein n=1 Tax=Oedothorax gibbosus TaxID=931172 RepID=A0AAV6VK70_9ARAC|nr:hypothetical protein JTE90_012272 [Oedothorax gibbosus]
MKADLEEKKKSIKDLEVKALATSKDKKEVGKSALSLFKEANERLKQGIKDNDLNSIRVAQGMLEGAEKLREKEKEHEEKEEKN